MALDSNNKTSSKDNKPLKTFNSTPEAEMASGGTTLNSNCAHKWEHQRMGGRPDDPGYGEGVTFCRECGEEWYEGRHGSIDGGNSLGEPIIDEPIPVSTTQTVTPEEKAKNFVDQFRAMFSPFATNLLEECTAELIRQERAAIAPTDYHPDLVQRNKAVEAALEAIDWDIREMRVRGVIDMPEMIRALKVISDALAVARPAKQEGDR